MIYPCGVNVEFSESNVIYCDWNDYQFVTYGLSKCIVSCDVVSGTSVSGYMILDTAKAAGADITEADIKCEAWIPTPIYAAKTPPATVARPPVMTA